MGKRIHDFCMQCTVWRSARVEHIIIFCEYGSFPLFGSLESVLFHVAVDGHLKRSGVELVVSALCACIGFCVVCGICPGHACGKGASMILTFSELRGGATDPRLSSRQYGLN